jgi:TM2 domain-containing membrane protein YozV
MATNSTATPSSPTLTPERNGFRYGLLTAAVLCVYTLIAVLAGFFQNIEAGALDVAILMLGSVLAIRHFRQVRGDHMPYLGGYGTGIITALVASIILGLFFVLMQAIFPDKLDLTQVQNVFGFELSTIIALLAIILMGAMTGVITSLIAMQYFKVQVSDPLAMMKES